jgi:hypothetical protein
MPKNQKELIALFLSVERKKGVRSGVASQSASSFWPID